MSYNFYKEITLTENQTIIHLEKPVIKELTELVLNGIELFEEDFKVIDPKTISIFIDTYEGDLLKIKCQKVKIDYTIIGDHNAVIKRYDNSKETLKKNSFYEAKIMIGGKPFSLNFSSKFDKYYNNKKVVKEDCLMLESYLTNHKVDNRIYQNSKEISFKTKAIEKYADLSTPPYEIQQYVRYKTDIDLINSIYLVISSEIGTEQKKYGTTDIKKEVKLPEIELMLQGFKDKLLYYDEFIFGSLAVDGSVIVAAPVASKFRKSVNSNDTTYNPFNERNTF